MKTRSKIRKFTVTFDGGEIGNAQRKLNSLVSQINSYSAGFRTVSRKAHAVSTKAYGGTSWNAYPYWSGDLPEGTRSRGYSNLEYEIPMINQSQSSSRSGSRGGYSGGSSAMSNQGSGVVVNVYDGTGQKISEYDSSIRIQINERANRYGEFASLPVS